MRNRIIEQNATTAAAESHSGSWDLARIATVEVTSENPRFPIESVFTGSASGWRAGQTGDQTIRLIFDAPVSVRRIQLRFEEPKVQRTQEFVLSWSAERGGPNTEIIRQQWNFSPVGSTIEVEDYAVDLQGLSVLELTIRPDLTQRDAVATLAAFHLK